MVCCRCKAMHHVGGTPATSQWTRPVSIAHLVRCPSHVSFVYLAILFASVGFFEVTVGTAAYIGAWLLVMALGDQCVNVLPLDNEGVPSAEIHATLDCGFPATHALFLEPER